MKPWTHFLMAAFVAAILLPVTGIGQHYFTTAVEAVNAQEYGNIRPRIVALDDGVGVAWTKAGGDFYYTTNVAGAFNAPKKLNAGIGEVFVSGYGGVDVAAHGMTVFATFMTTPYLEAELFWLKSEDGGLHWTDPVKLSMPDSIIPFLPHIDVNESGDPAIMFMAYDSIYHDPQYVIARSHDGGASFEPLASLSGNAPHEVCDCCPAHVIYGADTSIGVYRNNDQDIRDMWVATLDHSEPDTATTYDIDPSNWFIQGCPSTGPDALYAGGVLHSVWITGALGANTVMYSQTDVGSRSFDTSPFSESGYNQMVPRLAGNGDTLAMLFEQVGGGATTVVLAYSLDGGAQWTSYMDIVGDSNGVYNAPDIAFSNGGFDLVYRNLFEYRVEYKRLEFGFPAGIQMADHNGITSFPNPVKDVLTCEVKEATWVQCIDARGNTVDQKWMVPGSNQWNIGELAPGVYFLKVAGSSFTDYERIVKL